MYDSGGQTIQSAFAPQFGYDGSSPHGFTFLPAGSELRSENENRRPARIVTNAKNPGQLQLHH